MMFQKFKDISISKKLYLVFGTMALLVIVELITLHFAMRSLSALRAFIGGEASWSKAQKNAVYRFQRYAMTKNEKDYLAFHEALRIPDGDRKAREELNRPRPNLEIVRSGFIQGHVHPDDIDPVVNLLRHFSKVSYIREAVHAWTEGDKLLIELKDVVLRYHSLINDKKADPIVMQNLLDKVIEINDGLTKVEEKFSQVLGEGSRWLESIVFMSLFVLVITIESLGLILTFGTSRSISKGLLALNKLSNEFGHGHFERRLAITANDEIGQLTHSLNTMGEMLQKSYNDLQLSYKDLDQKIQARTLEIAEIAIQNNELYKEAKTAIKMRDDFLSIASHELRTPLTALNLQLYQLEKVAKNNSGKQVDLEQITKISHRASFLVKKLASLQEVLMDLAQLRLGKLEIKKSMTDFTEIVSECVTQVNTESTRRGAEFIFENDGPIFGNIDGIRVAQVVTNLLTNAIKYGDCKSIKIKVRKNNSHARVEVIDQGPGIPLEKQEQIFDRFERVSEDPAVSGLGLGLYISKQIVEAHNGEILVESVLGVGTKFTATFHL
jgi:signal transduction histidine kinase